MEARKGAPRFRAKAKAADAAARRLRATGRGAVLLARGLRLSGGVRLGVVPWSRTEWEESVSALAQEHGLGLGKLAQPLRAALAGRMSSPSVFDMMLVLGRDESLARIKDTTE